MMIALKGEFTVADYIDQGPYYPDMSYQEAAACYNGMGTEWMGKKVRGMLDEFFAIFRDAVIIHDVGYMRGITPEDRLDEDRRMWWNMFWAIHHHIPIWNIRRRLALLVAARAIYRLLRIAGQKAFEDCKKGEVA